MAQTTRDSTVAVGHIEEVHDAFEDAIADGQVCVAEIVCLGTLLDRAVNSAYLADTSTALSVCVGRGGLDGDRFIELATDYRRLKIQTVHLEGSWNEPLDAA